MPGASPRDRRRRTSETHSPNRPGYVRSGPDRSSSLIQQFEEAGGGEKVAASIFKRGCCLRVRAPLLQLPAIIDTDRLPPLFSRNRPFADRERGDERAADR